MAPTAVFSLVCPETLEKYNAVPSVIAIVRDLCYLKSLNHSSGSDDDDNDNNDKNNNNALKDEPRLYVQSCVLSLFHTHFHHNRLFYFLSQKILFSCSRVSLMPFPLPGMSSLFASLG